LSPMIQAAMDSLSNGGDTKSNKLTCTHALRKCCSARSTSSSSSNSGSNFRSSNLPTCSSSARTCPWHHRARLAPAQGSVVVRQRPRRLNPRCKITRSRFPQRPPRRLHRRLVKLRRASPKPVRMTAE